MMKRNHTLSWVSAVMVVCVICIAFVVVQSRQASHLYVPDGQEGKTAIQEKLKYSESADSIWKLMEGNADFCQVTTEEGLPSQSVTSILRDKQGFVWIGTGGGVARFDGAQVYVCPATRGENVWSLEELDADTLLVGTSSGLGAYSRRNETWTDLNMPATIVKDICKLPDGKVLVGTEDGLFLWDRKHVNPQDSAAFRRIRVDTGMGNSNHITGFLLDGKRGCWFSTANGLGYYNVASQKTQLYRMPEDLDNSNFFNSLAKAGSTIFLGSFNKGVFGFDIPTRTFSKVAGFEHNLVLKTEVLGRYLLVGTNGLGIKVKNLLTGEVSAVKHTKAMGSLCSNTVQEIQVLDGRPWIGTQFGGLSYLPHSAKCFDAYSYGDFFSSDYSVRYFYEYADGAKLIATRSGLFYIDEQRNIVKHYSADDARSGLQSNIVTFINRVNQQVLVGTFGGGIYVFDRESLALRSFSHDELGLYGCVFHILGAENGGMWVASQEGLYLLSKDREVLKHFTPENSRLKSPAIFKLCKDALGRLWVGTYAGLFIVDTHTCNILPCQALPSHVKVNCLLLDSDQTMWVASNMGLFHLDSDLKLLDKYDGKNGLPEDYVASICHAQGKSLLVSTLHTITRLDLSYRQAIGHVFVRLPKEGTFNDAPVVCDSNGSWWASEKGLFSVGHNIDIFKQQGTAQPFVASYALDGVKTLMDRNGGDIEVKASVKEVKFSLTNLLYARPYSNSYEYMLEGYDKNWHVLEGENVVAYENLPSGNYILKVRDPKTKCGTHVKIHVQMNNKVVLAIACGLMLLLVLVWYSYRKITYLRNRLKKEREVLGDAVNSKKTTMEARKVNVEDVDGLAERLLEHMQKEKPYLNARLTIGELATHLSSNEAEISLLLNNKMNMNWANFVNAYRVEEMKQRLLKGGLDKFTLTALAEQCGFVSKTTFYRVFKQMTGITPSEYCRQNNISVSKR